MDTGAWRAWIAILVIASAGCETVDRGEERAVAADSAGVRSEVGGMVLSLNAPGFLRPGQEGDVRFSILNRSDTTIAGVRAVLFLPGWMVPDPPERAGMPVTMVAADAGTRLTYPIGEPPLQPGESRSIIQGIRTSAPAGNAAALPLSGAVRAWLVNPRGENLGAEIQSEVALNSSAPDADTADLPTQSAEPARVSGDGVGPVRLGMTMAEIREISPQARDTTWSAEGMTERGMVVPLDGGRVVTAQLVDGSVARIYVRDRALRTAQGLGVGSRLGELRAAYRELCADVGEGTVVIWSPGAAGISFGLTALPPARPERVRENPAVLPDSTTVAGMWVRRGTDDCPGQR